MACSTGRRLEPVRFRLVAVERVPATGVFLLSVVTASHLINDLLTSMLQPLLPALRQNYDVSIVHTSLLVAILSFVGSMLQPFAGVLGERIDRRILAAIGPILTSLGMSLIGYAPNFAFLGVLIVVGGLGSALFHPAGASYVLAASRGNRGLFASIFSAGGTAGAAIGPLCTAWLGLAGLPWLLPIGVLIGAISYAVTPSTRVQGSGQTLRGVVRLFRGPLRTLWAMSVLRTLSTTAFTGLIGFVLEAKHLSSHTAPTLAVFSFASAFGGIVAGRLSDRLGRLRVLRSGILVSLPIFVWLVFSSPLEFWYYPLVFLIGALVSGSVPVAVVTAQEYAPDQMATASALMMGFAWGTAGVLFLAIGALADWVGPQTAMLVAVAMLLPGLWFAWRLPEPSQASTS